MAWIAGRVVDADGMPAEDVDVRCRWHIDLGEIGPKQVIRTSADGRFRFDDLVDGHYRISATRGYESFHGYVATDHESEIALRQVELTKLTVVDEESRPIAHAQVTAGYWRSVHTDEAGQVMAFRHGFFRVSAPGYVTADAPFHLGPEYTMVMVRGALIAGVVVDPNGNAVADAHVWVRGTAVRARTDTTGRWHARVAAGRLALSAAAILDVEGRPTEVDHDGKTDVDGVVVRTRWPATLRIQIVDRHRQPVAYANVRLTSEKSESRSMRTRSNGICIARRLVPGAYTLSATTRRDASALIGVMIGEGLQEATLVVEPDRGIAGQVIDTDDRPIAGLLVRGTSRSWRDVITDDNGRFDLGGAEPSDRSDSHFIIASGIAKNRVRGTAHAMPGDMNVRIVVRT
ncbi:MAG: carboxypeptidase-like regulatory domain-containing protein [Kofleriaceae bacterium]